MTTRYTSRRQFLTAAGAAGLAGLLPGCGNSAGSSGLSFADWDEVTKETPLGVVIDAYEKETGRSVTIQPGIAGEEYNTKMRTMLGSNTAPSIMRVDDDFVPFFSQKKQLADLKPYVEKSKLDPNDYLPVVYDFGNQPDGTYTTWCLGHQPRVIFYNRTMFEEVGAPLPPRTWTSENWTFDDFLETAKALTVEGERYGALVIDDGGYEQYFPINNGGEGVFSSDGLGFTLADEAGAGAIQYVVDLSCKHKVQPPWSQLQQDDAGNQMFVSGRIGMISRTLGNIPYFRESVKDFDWDVAPVPGNVEQKTATSIIVFCVPSATEDIDAAWDLLKYMSGKDAAKTFAEMGAFIPGLKSASQFVRANNEPPQNMQLFLDASPYSMTIEPAVNTERAEQIYRPELDKVYNCQADAFEALGSVRDQVEAALAGEL